MAEFFPSLRAGGGMSKREELREKRRMEKTRRRRATILLVLGGALVLAALMILPSIRPIGEISLPEFRERPMAEGKANGDPDAPVVIEVFEDFLCHACASYSFETEAQIEEVYITTGDVYYIYRHYAFLDTNIPGEESHQSASASMCAADQDRFWDYHDVLFANLDNWSIGYFSDRRLVAFAEEIGLDMTAFERCFEDRIHYDLIDDEFELGNQMFVTGTPSVFVNGVQVTPGYVPTFEQLSEVIEEQLAALEAE
jgi:protein-disulfide isomerase